VHTFAECKTDISAVLTVTSGPDSHMMSKLESHGTWRRNLVVVDTSCFGGMAIPCWQNCYPVFLIGINLNGVASPSYYLRYLVGV